MNPDLIIEFESLPFVRIYKSGRVERLLGTTIVPASIDPATAVNSKDIIINPTTGVSARLYLPSLPSPTSKLPVLVYFHGGGFIIESASSPTYHNYLNSLAAKATTIVVSVDYRCAPENPLPAAHDDSWEALQWVELGSDPWLAEHGDMSRLFLAGDSSGGNIVHHMAVRAGRVGLSVHGMALIHPYFGSRNGAAETEKAIWSLICPGGEGLEELLMVEATGLRGVSCRRVVVFVAEKDELRERGRGYHEGLLGSGWSGEAELVEAAGEEHVFHLFRPECENAGAMMGRLVDFLNTD